MDGEPIPETDHVTRYVSPSKYVNKILDWTALLPRPVDEGEASYNWLEYLGNGTTQELVMRLKASLTKLTIKKTGTFATLNVGEPISGMQTAQPDIQLKFIHTPKPPENESHASMFGLDHLNDAAGRFLNDLCQKLPTE